MLLISEFVRDLNRFRRHGSLSTVFVRRELAVWAVTMAAITYWCKDALSWVLWGIISLIFLHIILVSLTVQFLSPIYFGRFSYGRLQHIEYVGVPTRRIQLEFVGLPSGVPLPIGITGVKLTAEVGKTYLLLMHPANEHIALPMLDSDHVFFYYILRLANDARRLEILEKISRLRETSSPNL